MPRSKPTSHKAGRKWKRKAAGKATGISRELKIAKDGNRKLDAIHACLMRLVEIAEEEAAYSDRGYL